MLFKGGEAMYFNPPDGRTDNTVIIYGEMGEWSQQKKSF